MSDALDFGIDIANAFLEILPQNYPDFRYNIDTLYVIGLVAQIISSEGTDYVNDDSFTDILVEKLNNDCEFIRNDLLTRCSDIIGNTSNDIIDAMAELSEAETQSIMNDAITRCIDNEMNVYDTSGFQIIVRYIEPYLRAILEERNLI